MTILVADYISKLTGGFWRLDADTAPATPTLSVANDGDGASVTASVTGASGATHQLYYMARGGSAWTAGSTRVGDGDIAQSGLLEGTYYFTVQSSLAGVLSVPSALSVVGVLSTSTTAQIEDAIYHHCADTVAIAALVGTRIYRVGSALSSVTATQDYITYQRISTQRAEHQAAADTLADVRIQFNAFSATPKGAKAIASELRDAWDNAVGNIGQAGRTVAIKAARIAAESADYVESHDGGQIGKHRYIVDVLIWYTE